ncbi:hypothetical protein ACFOUP_18870 [Belliella kenyensis]|uniref:GSKIP domain-containing protein n=1 Tax=Belliella kenyensis TaxID=1472724 RepID=A0ABV8ESY9_9BACT|nr:hypothetical protein [Belliella kenyensis]MCH7402160.1 hypothetical protein [Belliella kenyensis]MDN3601675.1 hypothetical protein [Belliella kenyensis]
MRVVNEFQKDDIRISLYSWNNKYLIKFELGPMEQTFKVSEMDVLVESDLEGFYEGDFFEKVKLRFQEMGASLKNQMESM